MITSNQFRRISFIVNIIEKAVVVVGRRWVVDR
jgi:hypothetical protein